VNPNTILPIETRFRRIISPIPHPDSLSLLQELERAEPRSMGGMPPIVWERAEGFRVFDAYGNQWVDFTSAVVLANAGHANSHIGDAIREQLAKNLWHNYCNPSGIRLRTVKAIAEIVPPYLDKVFLLTTGAEAVECAIKLMRLHGRQINPQKFHVVSFLNSFHGRTLGAQTVGGYLDQQEWMGERRAGFHHIPYPECARCPWGRQKYEYCGQECLEKGLTQLREAGVPEDSVAGVITETFQGPTVAFMPLDFVAALRAWCSRHQALLAFDEIQAGFGRTGRWFGFEDYGVEADLICMGKGMTSCLPMAAVAGRAAILDIPEHGQMSSTHTGNPLCCAAALANIEAIRLDHMVEHARKMEPLVLNAFASLRRRFPQNIGTINGKGLAWAVYLLDPASGELNVRLAQQVTTRCMEMGLLMLQTGRGTLKIAPPLCISSDALAEGIGVIGEALAECVNAS